MHNSSWDEWVPESRVLKYNEANVARQKEVQKAHSAQPTKAKKTTKKSFSVKAESVKDGDSRASTPVTEVARGNWIHIKPLFSCIDLLVYKLSTVEVLNSDYSFIRLLLIHILSNNTFH